jgi:hypothetical protein
MEAEKAKGGGVGSKRRAEPTFDHTTQVVVRIAESNTDTTPGVPAAAAAVAGLAAAGSRPGGAAAAAPRSSVVPPWLAKGQAAQQQQQVGAIIEGISSGVQSCGHLNPPVIMCQCPKIMRSNPRVCWLLLLIVAGPCAHRGATRALKQCLRKARGVWGRQHALGMHSACCTRNRSTQFM